MTARNTPAGSFLSPVQTASTFISGFPGGSTLGQGSSTSLTAVYPYSPPSSGQQWPRPY